MAHIHQLPDGTFTGKDEPVGNELHDHKVDDMIRTHVSPDRPGHIHTVLGSITGPAVPPGTKEPK